MTDGSYDMSNIKQMEMESTMRVGQDRSIRPLKYWLEKLNLLNTNTRRP